jgi:hypothetical protein
LVNFRDRTPKRTDRGTIDLLIRALVRLVLWILDIG